MSFRCDTFAAVTLVPQRGLQHAHAIGAAALSVAFVSSWGALRELARSAPESFGRPDVAAALLGPPAWVLVGLFGACVVMFAFRRGEPGATVGTVLALGLLAVLEAATPQRFDLEQLTGIAAVFMGYALASRIGGDASAAGADEQGREAALGVAAAVLVLSALSPWLAGENLFDARRVADRAVAAAAAGALELHALRTEFGAQAAWCELTAAVVTVGKLGGVALVVPRARTAYAAIAVLGSLLAAVVFGVSWGPAVVGLLVLICAQSERSPSDSADAPRAPCAT